MCRKPAFARVLLGGEIMVACLLLPSTTRCGASHLLQPGSLEAFHDVATPFLFLNCSNVTIAPVYSLDATTGTPQQTGGVMVGGCGKLAELRCGPLGTDQPPACEPLKEWVPKGDQCPVPAPIPDVEAP
jgi:hypothetical protein